MARLSPSHLISFSFGALTAGIIAAACAQNAPEDDAPAAPPDAAAAADATADAEPAAPAPAHIVSVNDAPARTVGQGLATVRFLATKDNGAQSAFMAQLEMVPGAAVPVHRDATEEYIYFLEGSGEITIDGNVSQVGAGDAIFMPANAEVSFQAGDETPIKALQVFAPQGPEAKYDKWDAVAAAN